MVALPCSEGHTITRVSSMRGMPSPASCASRPAGCENGVMRTYIGRPACANKAEHKASLSANGKRPTATALMQRARLALPAEKRTSQPSSQRC